MTSSVYELFVRAMRERRQVVCIYQGQPRILCPAILGHTDGAESVLVFQVGGTGSAPLPGGGAWKCLKLANVEAATLRDGEWTIGTQKGSKQTCVQVVDYDINPQSPYRPKSRL